METISTHIFPSFSSERESERVIHFHWGRKPASKPPPPLRFRSESRKIGMLWLTTRAHRQFSSARQTVRSAIRTARKSCCVVDNRAPYVRYYTFSPVICSPYPTCVKVFVRLCRCGGVNVCGDVWLFRDDDDDSTTTLPLAFPQCVFICSAHV